MVMVKRSQFGNGGGIFTGGASTVRVTDSVITGNQARFYGGGIANDNEDFSDNVIITNSVISNNKVEYGGGSGIWTVGYIVFSGCTKLKTMAIRLLPIVTNSGDQMVPVTIMVPSQQSQMTLISVIALQAAQSSTPTPTSKCATATARQQQASPQGLPSVWGHSNAAQWQRLTSWFATPGRKS